MNHTDQLLISLTSSAVALVGGYTIATLSKHINKLNEDVIEAIVINKKLQQEVIDIKIRIDIHRRLITEIDKTLEGIAYAIPYNNDRAWQTKIVQKKLKEEMAKCEDGVENSDDDVSDESKH
jgi:hypothetical protein